MAHKFQIHLRGIIDLLSKHLYSGPEVFVRELLQNGVDAIRARQKVEPEFAGSLSLELHTPKGKPATLVATDDGIGLTEEEVHKFLATIGESSKRMAEGDRPTDFIGQFGVGILSCFLVSDEIVVISRSAKKNSPAVEWRAKPDGTYDVRTLTGDLSPGTQVILTAREDAEEFFKFERLSELVKHFGGMLPYPIKVSSGKRNEIANERGVPWRQEFSSEKERTQSLLRFGLEAFGLDFLDALPLRSKAGDIDGVAFILPHEASLTARRAHRVYLKNMLLSESADNLLPDWAFFLKAVVNANDLRPTASRETFYDDDKLAAARDSLGDCLRAYLVNLAEKRPEKLEKFIDLHHRALKALAAEDDEFYRLFIDYLPFETTHGRMSLGEYRREHGNLLFTPTVDQFRQIARVASAQGRCVINAGYSYDHELLTKAPEVFDDLTVEELDATEIVQSFEDVSLEEQESAHLLMSVAESALKSFRCEPELKKFKPNELPALFSTSKDGRFFRSLEQSKEIADPLWGGVLDQLGKREKRTSAHSQLCFNFENPLVRRLVSLTKKPLLRRSVEMLYVQSLLLAHQPLNTKEMGLLNDGLLAMIEFGMANEE
ncbi:MAG: HSP90 family protein [Gemmataceae bacterium]|nr:HSP90 family protein [Gemmataceae bacterium]